MEMFFLERNDKRFDAAQKELANARMMGMQYDLGRIDQAEQMVHKAVSEGYASGDDIQRLLSLDNPQEMMSEAGKIMGSVNAEMRRLQIESQRISNWATTRGVQLREQELEDSRAGREAQAAIEADKLTIAFGEAYVKDERIRQFTTTQEAYERFNATLPGRTEADFKALSDRGDNAAERNLVTAFVRMTMPDITRASDAGDVTATNAINEQVERRWAALTEDKGSLPRKLKELATQVDSLYDKSVGAVRAANEDWNSRLTSGVALPVLARKSLALPDGVGGQITEALNEGYTPSQIVSVYIQSDPEMGGIIKQAKERYGYNDAQIINFLREY
jgi:hypothetical protein